MKLRTGNIGPVESESSRKPVGKGEILVLSKLGTLIIRRRHRFGDL